MIKIVIRIEKRTVIFSYLVNKQGIDRKQKGKFWWNPVTPDAIVKLCAYKIITFTTMDRC